MKSIKLEYTDYTVTDETYKKIVSLVQTERVCRVCEKTYTADNPEALKNQCLNCVKGKSNLEYVGRKRLFTQDYYCFKGTDGDISIADNGSEAISRSVNGTLQYYGFSYPFEWEGKRIYKDWYVAGNPEKDSCVLLSGYIEFYNDAKKRYDSKKVEFFSFKNKQYIPVNRRKKSVRDLFRKAQAVIEKTKDDKGHYNYNGSSFFYLPEHAVNTEAAKRADYTQV
jgi:hypothetical protein